MSKDIDFYKMQGIYLANIKKQLLNTILKQDYALLKLLPKNSSYKIMKLKSLPAENWRNVEKNNYSIKKKQRKNVEDIKTSIIKRNTMRYLSYYMI